MRNLTIVLVLALAAGLLSNCNKKQGSPDIEQSCTMNGMGSGECDFTNTGDGPGAVCGKIVVSNSDTSQTMSTGTFCSGEVKTMTTVKMSFQVVGVQDGCGSDWAEKCSFGFIEFEKNKSDSE